MSLMTKFVPRVKFEEPAKKAFVWGFYHGKYGDSWSILHILSGTLLAVAALYLDLSLVVAYTIIIPLLFAYEFGEAVFKIAEDVENAISDVVFGLIGFFAIFGIHYFCPITGSSLLYVAAGLSAAALGVLAVGFTRYSAHRKSDQHDGVLRPGDTPQSRREITRDNILFFGYALVTTPIFAVYETYNMLSAAMFVCIGYAVVTYLAQKALRT